MHGKVSNMLGDPTPAIMGRLTLNPLAHLDPVGALALILFRIGWARPVPVNPRYYENPRKGLVYVALAGPASNFFLALVFAALLRLSLMTNFFGFYYLTGGNSTIIYLISNMLYMGVSLNITLALFNLLPLPPLDGSKILMGILPARFSRYFYKLEGPLGLIIILVLFTFDIIGKIIYPLASFFLNILV